MLLVWFVLFGIVKNVEYMGNQLIVENPKMLSDG